MPASGDNGKNIRFDRVADHQKFVRLNPCKTVGVANLSVLNALVSSTGRKTDEPDSPVGHSFFNCKVSPSLVFDVLEGNVSTNLFLLTNGDSQQKRIVGASRQESEINTFSFTFSDKTSLVLSAHPHSSNNTIVVNGKTHKCASSNAVSLQGLSRLVERNSR